MPSATNFPLFHHCHSPSWSADSAARRSPVGVGAKSRSITSTLAASIKPYVCNSFDTPRKPCRMLQSSLANALTILDPPFATSCRFLTSFHVLHDKHRILGIAPAGSIKLQPNEQIFSPNEQIISQAIRQHRGRPADVPPGPADSFSLQGCLAGLLSCCMCNTSTTAQALAAHALQWHVDFPFSRMLAHLHYVLVV
jgi:hypothetical protein